MKFRQGLPFSFALCIACWSGSALCASLLVKPTTVIIARGESASTVTVTNSGDAPITAQVRVFAWDQQVNEDKLAPSTALAASPPMISIAPGQSQTVRIVRTAKAPATTEESYRLLVDEISDGATPVADAGTTVAIRLRYSVPVFVMPKPKDAAKMVVKAELASGALLLDASNRGKVHAQVSNISLLYANGSSQVIGPGLVGYVLPDKQRQWKLQLPKTSGTQGAPQRVRAMVNGQELLVSL